MAFVYIAPLRDHTAFKVGKAIAPSSRLSQLLRFYDFATDEILIIDCGTADHAFAFETLLHKACKNLRVALPHDGGTEFFAHSVHGEVIEIANAVCRINGFERIPFVRQKNAGPVDETSLIVSAFASAIRARRLEMNISQAEMAALAGLSKRTVERIENSGQATFHNMVAALRALNLESMFSTFELSPQVRQRATKTSFRPIPNQ